MTAGLRLPVVVDKELRAQLPIWLASAAALWGAAVLGDGVVIRVALMAYVFGSVALGAQAIGHEYSCGTLGMLLSQPCDRRRLLLTKLGVLAPLLLSLTALAWFVLFGDDRMLRGDVWRNPPALLLAGLCGLCVAPWLTMVCRSPLGGLVFTITIPLCLLLAGDVLGVALYGSGAGTPIDEIRLAVVWWGTLAVCAVGAVSTWATFMRLEAIEGAGPAISLPRWFRDPGRVRPRHPLWLLAKKEIHLQQMTLVIVFVFATGWITLSVMQQTVPGFRGLPLGPLTMLYLLLMGVLVGSLASAEERQLGTHEWQTLLPMAAWQQWAVKVGVAWGLALLLGMGVPLALTQIAALPDNFRLPIRAWREFSFAIVVLTTGSLYVSSLSPSGLRAMALVLPVGLGASVLDQAVSWAAAPTVRRIASGLEPDWLSESMLRDAAPYVPFALGAGFVVLLLPFAYVNHRSAERSWPRIRRQASWIAAYLVVTTLLRLIPSRF